MCGDDDVPVMQQRNALAAGIIWWGLDHVNHGLGISAESSPTTQSKVWSQSMEVFEDAKVRSFRWHPRDGLQAVGVSMASWGCWR